MSEELKNLIVAVVVIVLAMLIMYVTFKYLIG